MQPLHASSLLALALFFSLGCRERLPARSQWAVAAASVGVVHFGMPYQEAVAALKDTASPTVSDSSCDYWYPRSGPPGLGFMVEDGKIVRADVDSPGVATLGGLEVGSAVSAVRARLGPTLIDEPHKYEWASGWRYLSVSTPDSVYGLVFEVDSHVVRSYRAGRWPPVGYVEHCS